LVWVWVWVSIGYTGHHPWPGCSRELSQGAKNKNSLWLRAKCSAQFVDWQGLRIADWRAVRLQGKMKSEMLPCHTKRKKSEKKVESREKESSSREIYLYLFARTLTFISFPVELS